MIDVRLAHVTAAATARAFYAPDGAAQLANGRHLVVEPHVVDHDQGRLHSAGPPQDDPQVGMEEVSAPFGAERLHGMARGRAAEKLARDLLQGAVDVLVREAGSLEHVLEHLSEPLTHESALDEDRRRGALT